MTIFKLIDNKLTFEIQVLNLIQAKQDEGHQIQETRVKEMKSIKKLAES